MTIFLRLLSDKDKQLALLEAVQQGGEQVFTVEPSSFRQIPGAPFAYWVSEAVRGVFQQLPAFESESRVAQHGGSTKDDFRFLRIWWENKREEQIWFLFAKGGAYSPYYSDIYLTVNWQDNARELEAALLHKYPYLGETANWVLHRECNYYHPGLTWPRRTTSGISLRVMPAGCIFADKGPAVFVSDDEPDELLALLAVANSRPFSIMVELQLAAADAAARSYEVGVIQRTPIPPLNSEQRQQLATLALNAWSQKRAIDTVMETSHAFVLPTALRPRVGDFDTSAITSELLRIQSEIDAIAFELYGFAKADRELMNGLLEEPGLVDAFDDEDESAEVETPSPDALRSWAVGVTFGRFDWRLATGERKAPPEPEPFEQLPTKSPGMLPDGAEPFYRQLGILVDDPGHSHDLSRLIEEVLERVNMPVPGDVRRWLQKNFFAFHLQRYSKSRRKAPIYWPLSTVSGSYTLWLYYPSLNSQTLYSAINDFVEPKLKQIGDETATLRNKGTARSQAEEKQFEELQTFELELIEFRDTLLKIAQDYHPNHDDGVQITAAPLWPLFRHKPWQKVLKDTWAKLEKGEYDWAHLAMNYWPNRVHEKCKTDKSLAIAHGLEEHYVEPEAKSKKAHGKKSKSSTESNF